MPTAAAYIRVSTEDQMEFSPDSQLRSIQAYALNHTLNYSLLTFIWTKGSADEMQANVRLFYR